MYVKSLQFVNISKKQLTLDSPLLHTSLLLSSARGQLFRRQKRCQPNKRRERRTDGGDERSVGAKVRAKELRKPQNINILQPHNQCAPQGSLVVITQVKNIENHEFRWITLFLFEVSSSPSEGKQLQRSQRTAKMWVNGKQWCFAIHEAGAYCLIYSGN